MLNLTDRKDGRYILIYFCLRSPDPREAYSEAHSRTVQQEVRRLLGVY